MIFTPETPANYAVELIETQDELLRLAPEWNSLLQASQADSLFLTWEWISSWLKTVAPQASPMVASVRDAEKHLIALAPFYRSPLYLLGRIPYQCLRILGDSNSGAEYPDIIIQSGLENKVAPLIAGIYAEHAKKWDWIWLPNVAGWTGARDRLATVFAPTAMTIKQSSYSFSALSLPDTWDAFASTLPKGRSADLRRQEQYAARYSPEILLCRDPQELPSFLDTFFQLHAKHWQSKGQGGSFARWPGMDNFYRDFTPRALAKGWLVFFSLRANSAMHATQLGYVYNNVYHALQEGRDPKGVRGAGNVLRIAVMRWCMEHNIQTYDFLGVHSPHKASWGGVERWGWRQFLGRRCLKNLPVKLAKIWPAGRFILTERR